MPDLQSTKFTVVRAMQKYVANPIGGKVDGRPFWMGSEPCDRSHYGLPDGDVTLPTTNSAMVKLMGSDLLTIRVDLD